MRAAHRSLMQALALLIVANGLGGCLAIVLPPTQVSFGVAGASGNFHHRDGTIQPATGAPTMTVRASVNPLQLPVGMRDRPIDFGIGYAWDWARTTARTSALIHGPYLEAGWFPFRGVLQDSRWRLGFHLAADLPTVYDSGGGRHGGVGATASSTLEFVGWSDSSDSGSRTNSSGFSAGAAAWQGEGAIGLTGYTSVRAIEGDAYWIIGIGITVRIPAIAGIGILIPSH